MMSCCEAVVSCLAMCVLALLLLVMLSFDVCALVLPVAIRS